MAVPAIGFDNLFFTGIVTVTSEAVGFPKENAYDNNTYDSYMPTSNVSVFFKVDMTTPRMADYFALTAHNLFTVGATVTPQFSDDNSIWTDALPAVTPLNNGPLMKVFPASSHRYWRLLFSAASAPINIGLLSIGLSLRMDRAVGSGFILPFDAQDDMVINQVSEGGQFLGRSVIRQGVTSELTFTLQTLAFVTGSWRTFLTHARTKPWWFSWNTAYDDVVFLWMEGNPRPSAFSTPNLLDIGLSVKGQRS